MSTGMTPIKWDGSTWVDTTEDDSDWYDYTAKKWANARTADGSMWVWIPRYIYKITSGWHSATAGKIEVQFSKGTNDNWNSSVIGNIDTGTTSNASNNKWTNHPAFNFGGTQLTGFWVAKFEASSYDTWCDNELASGCSTSSCKSACDRTISSPAFKPNAYSWRTVSVNNAFILSRNMETNSKYGWGTSGSGIDTHLMKNVEWGAVAYLTTSIYGNNNLLWRNNSYPYTTGCVGNSINAGAYWEGCAYQYHTGNGVRGSTTGNIYGVYDLRGGGNEILAAYIDNNHDTLNQHGSSLVSAASKYKDVYPTSYNNTINKKGDAFYETSNRDTGRYAWNNSHIGSPGFFIERGGFTNSGDTTSQIFGITFSTGGSDTGTFRTVLLVGEGL